MSLVLISLLLSLGFSGALFLIADRYGNATAIAFALVAVVAAVVLMFHALTLHVFFTLLATAVCAACGAKARTVLACSLVVAVGTYGWTAYRVAEDMRDIAQLQQEYPVVSLEDRLAYESSRAANAEVTLSSDVETRLSTQEAYREDDYSYREAMLRRLHHDRQLDFVLAQGFGYTRMRHVHRGAIELPETDPLPQPGPLPKYDDGGSAPAPLAANEQPTPASPPAAEELASLHGDGLWDFLDVERMGHVEDRGHVVGFASHQFRETPKFKGNGAWRVARVELISLLRHDEPVAYASDHLPNMEYLEGVPTRRLSGFEASAIRRLRREEDVVIDHSLNTIAMVGSLRASRDCLKCHAVPRGELLGAFTYLIERVEPRLPPEVVEPQARRRDWLY